MWKLPLLFLIVASLVTKIDGVNETALENYRLPKTIIPSRYQIFLTIPNEVLTGKNMTFTGMTIITFQATESTNIVKLHSTVNISSITLSSEKNESIYVKNTTLNSTTEILTIYLSNNLTTNINYDIEFDYSGTVDTVNMQGMYLSQYTVNGTKEYLVTTQFESTNARKVFPCFDEPEFKANFALSLTHPSGFLATSNTPPNPAFNDETGIGAVSAATTHFSETLRMSSYLLAFTVSKFNCTSRTVSSTSFEVCSRKAFAGDRQMALDYGIKILGAMDAWTNYYYNVTGIKKLDQFAIPDFSAGAMENWGMVTYKEMNILWNDAFTSDTIKQQIIMIIAHEFTHMWFGNLLTTKWWDTTFLNEGFARYFQYFIVNQLDGMSPYELDKQFIITQQHNALLEDISSSESLTVEVWTPEQIISKFNIISYSKGACIIRMIENIIGTNAFQTALRQYIKNNVFLSVTPDLLWTAFSEVIPNGILPETITFDQFIDNWTNKAGYPVVSVRSNGSNVILEQNRFLYNGSDSTQWYIPITYKLSGNATVITTWLEPNKSLVLNNVLLNNSWIIVNHNSQGYYRVHYDAILRERLVSALKMDRDQISVLDRAQLIDDTLNLARARKLKYSEAFKMLQYMKNETSYYAWSAVIKGLNDLKSRFGSSSVLGQRISNMMLDLIENEFRKEATINLTTANPINNLKLENFWITACKSGQEKCKLEATKLFRQFKNNGISIHPNHRYFVYCNALRFSSNVGDDWNFLINRLHTIDQPHETYDILRSLGCTSSKDHLKEMLNDSMNSSSIIRRQDINLVWSSVYTSSSVGVDFAFDYFTSNHKAIFNHFSKAGSLFLNIISKFTNEAQLTKLQTFINQQGKNTTIRSVAESGLQKARENINWQHTVQYNLKEYFGVVSSATTTAAVSIYLLITIVFFI